ncbi:MAG: alanine racemase [Acidobacteriia bacterium]|nr:alanine racemase [Terriglobia bacterium]
MISRRTWAEISASKLRHNFRTVQDYVAPQATVCAVVKADAYGHGAQGCARALELEGAKWFGVTSTHEGMLLRDAGINGRILVMAGFFRGEEEYLLQNNLTPTIWDWSHIELLEDAAEKMGKDRISVHLKVDTGMTRLGADLSDLPMLADALRQARHVRVEGFYSHLASAEVVDAPTVEQQIDRFGHASATIIEHGLSPAYYHIANSAALATRPKTWMNFVRPGLALYGYHLPFVSAETGAPDDSYELPVVPVLTWKTRVIALRDVSARTAIGYSGAYVTPAPARIAVLPVGYADGLNRQLSSRGRVIVRGDYASIIGNIAMDLTTIDVTRIPGVDIGDEVIIIGSQGDRSIGPWEHATLASTVAYEILCAISKRVPRKYVD